MTSKEHERLVAYNSAKEDQIWARLRSKEEKLLALFLAGPTSESENDNLRWYCTGVVLQGLLKRRGIAEEDGTIEEDDNGTH